MGFSDLKDGDRITADDFRRRMTKKHGRKLSGQTANSLTKAIVSWMNVNGFWVWRNNNHAVFDMSRAPRVLRKAIVDFVHCRRLPTIREIRTLLKSCFNKNRAHLNGVSDILGIEKATGRMVAIEVKAGNDRLSPEQVYFLQRIEKEGGYALQARCLNDVVEYFEKKKKQA